MSSFIRAVLVGALLAVGSQAGPVVQVVREEAAVPAIQERFAPIMLGNYSLATSHVNDVLFNLGITEHLEAGLANTVHLEIECVECVTWGSAIVTTSGVKKDEDIIGDIIAFFENPIDCIVNAFNLEVKVEFENVGGHFEFDITASDTVSYSYSIYQSETLAGMAVSSDVAVGLVLFIDLVFSLTAEIDLEAGFEFAFPEGAYITVDPLEGKIVDHGFTGGETNSLPVICTSGSATFEAALRVRVQAGTSVVVFGTGFDFSLGIYADLIEYEATLTTTPACELLITEWLDVNVGAYAHAVAEIDYKTFGFSPAVVTTLLEVPLPSLCVTRPHGSSLALPTSAPLSGVSVSTTLSAHAISTGIATYTAVSSSSTPGGVFYESKPTSRFAAATTSLSSVLPIKTGSPYSPHNATSSGGHASGTVSSPAFMVTSTVYTTSLITVTSCSSTVLHCPASAASEIIITSTAILYTTVCPYGAVLPTTLPASLSPSSSTTSSAVVHVVSTALVSPLPLTPPSSVVVSTVYIPTYANPTYTMPTETVFPVAYPNFTSSAIGHAVTATITSYPVISPSVSGVPTKASNATIPMGTAKVTPTSARFAGAAGRENAPFAFVVMLGVGLMALL